ncbi:hypothetical protein C8J57DRAFT_1565320 [Mycena rebaudengoi]|nr:hypothetical protein C8J57DRAFT_1565320 [Mycena rebaudengoi]
MASEPLEEEPPDPVVLAAQFEKRLLGILSTRTPRGFDKWFDFAKQKSCLIDDYDQIHRDFEPFYNWPKTIPCRFSDDLTYSWIWCLHRLEEQQSKGYQQDGGREREIADPEQIAIVVWNSWPDTFRRDEPCVVFNCRELGAHARAFNLTDESIALNSTSEFFNGQSGCNVLVRPDGLTESANGDISRENCAKPQCGEAAIKHEFNITSEPTSTSIYLLDVDGNTFSRQSLGLLRSGSLVFKMTTLEEFFNDWLRPFEHYIPVLPALPDLVEKIEWNDCYWVALLLEWAQLQEIGRNFT